MIGSNNIEEFSIRLLILSSLSPSSLPYMIVDNILHHIFPFWLTFVLNALDFGMRTLWKGIPKIFPLFSWEIMIKVIIIISHKNQKCNVGVGWWLFCLKQKYNILNYVWGFEEIDIFAGREKNETASKYRMYRMCQIMLTAVDM